MRLTLSALTGVVLVACAKPAPEAAGPNVVTITATDFAFAVPETIPAGLTQFRLVNHGQEPHHAVLIRVNDPRPVAEVLAALEAPVPPDWVELVPAPNTAVPGDSTNTTTILQPGRYLFVCFVPSPDGAPHVAKGMFKELAVGGTAPADAALPAADVVLTMSDYTFALSAPLTAGTHTIRVENAGPQMHEVGVERLADGKTMADYMQWGASGMQGPPPTTPVGGIIGPGPGGPAGTFTVTLTPGRYLLTCYVPDTGDGRPHVAHGMVQEIVIS